MLGCPSPIRVALMGTPTLSPSRTLDGRTPTTPRSEQATKGRTDPAVAQLRWYLVAWNGRASLKKNLHPGWDCGQVDYPYQMHADS